MHFRILKLTATSGFLTALECSQFFRGSLQRFPSSTSWFKVGPTFKGRGRKGIGKEEGRERGWDGRKVETLPPVNSCAPP